MAHPDLEKLLNALLPFAQQMLAKHGEFFPFGATVNLEGAVAMANVFDGDEHPLAQTVVDELTEALKAQATAGEIRAAAICYDGRVIPPDETEKCDAVCVGLEHESGEAADVFMPYCKKLFRGYKYGELFAAPRSPQFFIKRP